MKSTKLTLLFYLGLQVAGLAQNWEGSATPTKTSDYNTSIQLTHFGWGSHHGLLFNAYRSPSLVNGPLSAPGNTLHSFDVGPYGSGAGAIMYLGNGGRMDFLISGASTGAGTNVDWGAPKITITRTGVGIGSDDPVGNFEVRKAEVATGQTVDVAHFVFKGENHFDGPNIFSEGKLVLGSKAYGNGVLRRAEIGFSTSGSWRGGKLKFYTSPDNDTWTPLLRMTIDQNGNVGIGTSDADERLTVKGTVHSHEVRVDSEPEVVPDYVFKEGYQLLSLQEIESYIKANRHLPEVPSAEEIGENGLNLKEMNLILLRKIEELTLHVIELNKEIALLKQNNASPDLSGKKVEELTLHILKQEKRIAELEKINHVHNTSK